VHDVSVATNVFGEVWLDQMLVDCRSKNVPYKFSGCTDTNAWNCNGADRKFFWSFGGFQFYDTCMMFFLVSGLFGFFLILDWFSFVVVLDLFFFFFLAFTFSPIAHRD
jgi:hypothetical protein